MEPNHLDTWILINTCFFEILLFIPFNRCFRIDWFKLKESEIHKKTYDELYLDFIIDYERANPMTRIEGEMRYLDELEKKNKINKIEKNKKMKKIKEENQMKFYLRKQRFSRIINIKELNNLLNLYDDAQEKEKDIICNINPKIENIEKEGKIFKKKNQKNKIKKNKIKKSQ